MAEDRSTQATVGARPLDLAGDGPELVAFALLRYLAQLEQRDADMVFDRAWLLDAYAECLEAVQGKRAPKMPASKAQPTRSPRR